MQNPENPKMWKTLCPSFPDKGFGTVIVTTIKVGLLWLISQLDHSFLLGQAIQPEVFLYFYLKLTVPESPVLNEDHILFR
jgi:hypothetical protein